MSVEAPIQIDLSDNRSWDQVDSSLLSPEDKRRLAEQFASETQEIISLTQDELQTLRNALQSEVPEELVNFISQQREEWISFQDLFNWIEWIPEEFNQLWEQIATISRETLFWESGIMNGVELTHNAKENISTSFSLAALKVLAEMEWLTKENFQERFSTAIENQDGIRNVFSATVWVDDGLRWNVLEISWSWEFNSIFMNTSEWITFFEGVLTGTIHENQIEAYIEDRNLNQGDPALTTNIAELQTLSRDTLEWVLEKMGLRLNTQEEWDPVATVAWAEAVTHPPQIELPEDSQERQSFLERLQNWNMLEKILAAILMAIEWFTGQEVEEEVISNWVPTERPHEVEEVVLTPIEATKKSIRDALSSGCLVWMNAESIEAFLWNDANITQIMRIIEEIPSRWDEDTFEEKLMNLLQWQTESWEYKFTNFIEEGWLAEIKNSDTTLNAENFIAALTAYKNYRIAFHAHTGSTPLTYGDYFVNANE